VIGNTSIDMRGSVPRRGVGLVRLHPIPPQRCDPYRSFHSDWLDTSVLAKRMKPPTKSPAPTHIEAELAGLAGALVSFGAASPTEARRTNGDRAALGDDSWR
jgi:hypothetical protein